MADSELTTTASTKRKEHPETEAGDQTTERPAKRQRKLSKQEQARMPTKVKKGECLMCGKVGTKNNILHKHLVSECTKLPIAADSEPGAVERVVMLIEGARRKEYWKVVEVDPNVTLHMLEQHLKSWWDCGCGHRSSFSGASSSTKIGLLPNGAGVSYTFDMGTPTELEFTPLLRVKRPAATAAEFGDIKLMGQNICPLHKCSLCGGPAEYYCSDCCMNALHWDNDQGFYCSECVEQEDHKCKDHKHILDSMDIVNSPRWSMCGFK